jgi:hypothetical protein
MKRTVIRGTCSLTVPRHLSAALDELARRSNLVVADHITHITAVMGTTRADVEVTRMHG